MERYSEESQFEEFNTHRKLQREGDKTVRNLRDSNKLLAEQFSQRSNKD